MAEQAYTLPVPVEIRWLADVVGEDRAFAFIEAHGGQKVSIPRVRIDTSNLAKTWGVDLAKCLSERFGGEKYQVPLLKIWRIRRLVMMGYSYNEVSLRVGVCWDMVRGAMAYVPTSARRGYQHDDRQMALF